MNDSNMTAGLSQDYIDALTQELTTAENCYNEYNKAAQKAEDEYNRAKDWETCLKEFLDKITTTYDNVTGLNDYISAFVTHAGKVCNSIGQAKEATHILVLCMRCLSEQTEDLKKSLKELLEIIDCLNDPTLDPNVSIMKCLEDFKAKIDAGIVANLAAIKELLNLMKCVLELEYAICKTDDIPQGLISDLERLINILNCSYPHGSADSDNTCEKVEEAYSAPSDLECSSCKDDCGNPVEAAPHDLSCNKDDIKPALCHECGSSYQVELKDDYQKAAQQSCYSKCVWDYFKDLEQKAKANRDATQAALDAATGAKNKCK